VVLGRVAYLKPERKNYIKTLEAVKDVSSLTGLDNQAVKTVLKATSLVLAHYIAEESLATDGGCSDCVVEIPYIGTVVLNYDEGRPSTKLFNLEFIPTETFHSYLVDACREGKSPLEEAVVKKFVDVFIDKYVNVI